MGQRKTARLERYSIFRLGRLYEKSMGSVLAKASHLDMMQGVQECF